MTITSETNDFLMSSGGRSAKFAEVGATVKGKIVGAEKAQQTDMDGAPKTWDNGDPMWQLVVTLQTDERDPGDPDDDGMRKLYLKGSKPTTSFGAVRAAIIAAGEREMKVGGTLAVRYTGDGEPSKRGFNAPKEYAAKYEAPVQSVAIDDDADLF